MDNRVIDVPASLLLDPDLTAPAKVIWMALQLHPDAGPARLEALTGLSRHTVLDGLARVAGLPRPRGGPGGGARGDSRCDSRGGPCVQMPVALLAERRMRPSAKVLYGLLQTLPTSRGRSGQFTYASLGAQTGLSPNTLKRAISELEDSGFIRTSRKTRLSPVTFKLGTPALRRSEAEAIVAERRLKRASYGGEAIMQEYLSLLIDSKDFADNTRPGFLINPLTQERLELDRFYRSPKVAFEFHGDQHDRASGRFTQREVDDQRLRDLIKAGLCVYEGIHLVIVRAEDLSLQGMIRKIGQHMPLRDLDGLERLIDLLEGESMKYQASAHAARGTVE
ncbi:MAG TPA: winged helix-turn-helix transcriptional regulator [Symbiobacteriaceae bacterium]|nr:winged helix-turn-helix transcriptional regulator [Symbiobacteriaceae bacterium]